MSAGPFTTEQSATDAAWHLLLAASAMADAVADAGTPAAFRLDAQGRLEPLACDATNADVVWTPDSRWQSCLPPGDARSALFDLYLPICGSKTHPVAVGHLGQSLDGFIATHSGDSQFVTGRHNLVHLHRMRALCGAVVVGAGTVAADDPQLTTRFVPGPNPLRVIFDPARRLAATYRLFTDAAAPTLYVCGRSRIAPGETHVGHAAIVGVDEEGPERAMAQLLELLRARGHSRVFIEGGGITVSAFLEANLLDRLQIAIAPLLIGDGRPAIRLAPQTSLRDCRRPSYRVFAMGGDVLFDCDLRTPAVAAADTSPTSPIARII